MLGPPTLSVPGDKEIPTEVDIVIVGGGIIGAATALELAERGKRVALCEKGEIGHEQSSRNWGWVRISTRDIREIPLMDISIRLWEGMAGRIGRDVGYTKTGATFATAGPRDHARYERHLQNLVEIGRESEILEAKEVLHVLPGFHDPPPAVLYTPDDGRAEPQLAAPSIAAAARRAGATILTQCAVRGIDLEAGKVAGAVTERGRIKCGAIVLAGGAWSRLFSGRFGIELPQLKLLNSVCRTHPIANGPGIAHWGKSFSFRKRQDGGYTFADGTVNHADIVPDSFRLLTLYRAAAVNQWRDIRVRLNGRFLEELRHPRHWSLDQTSPFESCRVLDPSPHQRTLARVLRRAGESCRAFEGAQVAQSWGGLMDVTPDAVPVIAPVDDVPGFFISTGYSGHGFGIAPAAGQLMAELVCGDRPCVDPFPFRLTRFSDGSKINIDPALAPKPPNRTSAPSAR